MGTRKKIFLFISVLGLALLAWYLFVKTYDYQIHFSEKTAPGTLFYMVENWGLTLDKKNQLEILNTEKHHFSFIRQNLKIGDSLIRLDWSFESKNDSITNITVRATDMEHSMATRIKNLYTDPPLKKIFLSKFSDFKASLDFHLKEHKVGIIEEVEIPKGFYAYVSTESPLPQKANTMIAENSKIVSWLTENKIKILDEPILEVTSWDIENDAIRFNFMFPIRETDSLPLHDEIKYKKYGGQKAIKTIFNGNYMISDRAWFALYAYAERNKLEIEERPVEFFFNNPMEGGNALEWKAEAYLPLKLDQ
ncbi:MAG: hypothetical protein AAFZ89_01500 [Bacteroidota bacterium]